jgi:hypothetical protein
VLQIRNGTGTGIFFNIPAVLRSGFDSSSNIQHLSTGKCMISIQSTVKTDTGYRYHRYYIGSDILPVPVSRQLMYTVPGILATSSLVWWCCTRILCAFDLFRQLIWPVQAVVTCSGSWWTSSWSTRRNPSSSRPPSPATWKKAAVRTGTMSPTGPNLTTERRWRMLSLTRGSTSKTL